MSARHTEAALERHRKQRDADLLEMLKWGDDGVAPFIGLPTQRLYALRSRGMVEVRFHLTQDGRRAAEKAFLAATATKP